MTIKGHIVEKAAKSWGGRSPGRHTTEVVGGREYLAERLQNTEEVHKKWLTELKDQYTLVSKREWNLMKGEMKFIREKVIPEFYKSTDMGIHLDADYSDGEYYTNSE